jgi:hypothetical protein
MTLKRKKINIVLTGFNMEASDLYDSLEKLDLELLNPVVKAGLDYLKDKTLDSQWADFEHVFDSGLV